MNRYWGLMATSTGANQRSGHAERGMDAMMQAEVARKTTPLKSVRPHVPINANGAPRMT